MEKWFGEEESQNGRVGKKREFYNLHYIRKFCSKNSFEGVTHAKEMRQEQQGRSYYPRHRHPKGRVWETSSHDLLQLPGSLLDTLHWSQNFKRGILQLDKESSTNGLGSGLLPRHKIGLAWHQVPYMTACVNHLADTSSTSMCGIHDALLKDSEGSESLLATSPTSSSTSNGPIYLVSVCLVTWISCLLWSETHFGRRKPYVRNKPL